MRFYFIGLIFFALISCKSEYDKYPPLGWNESKIDSVLGCFGSTRGDHIGRFSDKEGVDYYCFSNARDSILFKGLINAYEIIDTNDARDCKQRMCRLIKETKSILIFSNSEDFGELTILRYKDGTELYHIIDTNSESLLGNHYWVRSFQNNLRRSKFYPPSWYFNERGTMFNTPD